MEHDAVASGHTVAINQFSDWTEEEFQSILALTIPEEPADAATPPNNDTPDPTISSLPASIDWRDSGAVVAVKDQGQCGSGWAFAAVAAIEGSYQRQTDLLISFSEQQLIDCTVDFNGCCSGCNGGIYWRAWEWLKANN